MDNTHARPTRYVVAAWLAASALLFGLLLGFMPTSAGGASCGSAFVASDDAFRSDLRDTVIGRISSRSTDCDSRRSIMRIPAIGLTLIGMAGLIGAAVARQNEKDRDAAHDPY